MINKPGMKLWLLASRIAAPFAALVWAVRLLRHARTLRRADVIYLPERPFNFGFMVQVCDIIRRSHVGQRCAVITMREKTYNRYMQEIFTDLDLIALRRPGLILRAAGREIVVPERDIVGPTLLAVTRLMCRLLAPRAVRTSILELLDARFGADESTGIGVLIHNRHNELVSSTIVGRIGPPATARRDIRRQIADAAGVAEHDLKLCAFFVRVDEKGPDAPRAGSGVAACGDAFQVIANRGYQIVYIGDEALTNRMRNRLPRTLFDAASLNVDHDLYRLFGGTCVDVWIGDDGAAPVFPTINLIPRLCLNRYPFYGTYFQAHNYLKSAYATDGRPLPLSEILQKYIYLIVNPNLRIVPNSAAEIAEAVRCFLDDIEKPAAPSPTERYLLGLWRAAERDFDAAHARLSPAWVNNSPNVRAELELARAPAAVMRRSS